MEDVNPEETGTAEYRQSALNATTQDAPEPAASRVGERRIDVDGQAKTYAEFQAAHGEDAPRQWEETHQRSVVRRSTFSGHAEISQPAESTAEVRRIAWDGEAYTYSEFERYYAGDAPRFWEIAARCSSGSAMLGEGGAAEHAESTADVAAISVDTPHTHIIQHDASQLAVTANVEPQHNGAAAREMHSCPRPSRAVPEIPTVASGAENTIAQRRALPSVCTFQEMQQMKKVNEWHWWQVSVCQAKGVARGVPREGNIRNRCH